MIIEVPVSRLTYKMIQYHHTPDKDGVIHISNRDFISDLLSHRWQEKLSRVERMNQVCDLVIKISLSKDLSSKLKDYTYECGLHLHRYFRSIMLHYIWAQYQVDVPAIDAIRNFYDEYDIDDEDYDAESCYRSWLRYKKEMEAKPTRRMKVDAAKYQSKIATREQLDMLITYIVSKQLGLFFSPTGETWIDSTFRHVSLVLHFFHSGLEKKDYCDKYQVYIRHLNRVLEKWEFMVKTTPDLLNTYRKGCEQAGLSLGYDPASRHRIPLRGHR